MRIEYMFIGKTADERTPQKKDITNAFKECFDDVKSNSFTIKPKTKVYTIDYEVNSWKAEDATEKFPVYDVIIKSEVEEKAKNAELLDIINTKISTCAEFRKKYNVVITYNKYSSISLTLLPLTCGNTLSAVSVPKAFATDSYVKCFFLRFFSLTCFAISLHSVSLS